MLKNKVVTQAMVLVATLGPAAAFAVDEVSTAMAPVQTTVIGYIAAGGAAGVAIMAVGLGWDTGISIFRKFIKKGAR
ncbi:hypothetical protein [Aeromonas caviae]|uniref:hypothetical protein n=1 Tax=Aeromonas caviae TaxID=648 RepID=UPI002B478461|nr:hypothetical protein [Aeromonas caviae]